MVDFFNQLDIPPLAYTLIQDQKASGTAGGTATGAIWNTRTLNTVVHDTGNNVSLASNQITLLAGTYRAQSFAVAQGVDNHTLRIRNITDSNDIIIGSNHRAALIADTVTIADLIGRFIITATKVVELQHFVSITKVTDGFGRPIAVSGVTEIYSSILLIKE